GERKLSQAEIRFYLGDLMLHRGSFPQAEAYLQDAVKLDPKLAGAHASLGALLVRQERYDEAKEYIDRALALGSNNPLPYFFYAQLILRKTQHPAELTHEQLEDMQAALSKAVRFGPHMYDAAQMLSKVNGLLGEN